MPQKIHLLRFLKRTTPLGRPFRWIAPGALILILSLLQAFFPNWAARIEGWTVDRRFAWRGVEAPQAPVIIVALDEASFQILGNLNGENIRTWPRQRWAALIETISAGRPRVIGLDVAFDTPGWDPGGDAALAGALERAGNVVLVGGLTETAGAPGGSSLTFSEPRPELAVRAAAVSVSALPVDPDGVIRRERPIWQWGRDRLLPSFASTVAGVYRGGPLPLQASDLGDDLSLPVNFRGPEGAFQTVPVYQVLAGEIAPEAFRDAIVLVGFTTLQEQDRHPAPFAGPSGMPGVAIQANVVDTLLAGDWLQRPPDWVPVLLTVLFGLAGLGMGNLPRPGWSWAGLAVFLLAYLAACQGLFARSDLLLPVTAPIVSAVAAGSAASLERLVFAERDKRLLRQRFAGIMSPERLQAVLDNWEALLDADRPEKEASVLFCDIRGFTHATEQLMHLGRSPEMVRFLNAYLDQMNAAVFQEGGVVYRTFGDGLLILFGVPEPLPDHAAHAVRAAVRMALATETLQDIWPLRNECPFQMGIGLNAGLMIDAIVGRGRRFDYTVLGDPVNTAARIEAHCKVVMETPRPPGEQVPENVTILISYNLYAQVRHLLQVDERIPPFPARGKSDPVQVVRVAGLVNQD